jgi:Holliday junction DNA helicase RuvA
MIGQIFGIILEKNPPQLLIDVRGIGYEIDASLCTFNQLPNLNSEIRLFTHLIIREDAHQLFGFYTKEERMLFRALLKVNGVGPRLALTILSHATPEEFVCLVLNNDTLSLVKFPGVGKKTAERLVIEMRDKLADWYQTPESTMSLLPKKDNVRHSILQDSIAALVSLGYKPLEASRVITRLDDGLARSEELIRRALKEMAK